MSIYKEYAFDLIFMRHRQGTEMVQSRRFVCTSYVFVLLLFLLKQLPVITSEVESDGGKCLGKERLALLKFKNELIDAYGRLSDWGTEECCNWKGVRCHKTSNHVIALDLRGPRVDDFLLSTPLRGNIGPLFELADLMYLDLSNNDFNTIQIPKHIGSLGKLLHLNLSHSNFMGSVPYELGRLSRLRVIDLSGNGDIVMNDLDWVSGMRSLEHLDLSGVNLYQVTTWMNSISKLKGLRKLFLRDCAIQETRKKPFPLVNGDASLAVLDLSSNSLGNMSLLWLLNYSRSFSAFDLSSNVIVGKIPDALNDLLFLSYLDLSFNSFEGTIPDGLGDMKLLTYLDLSGNKLEGRIPHALGDLLSLSHLDLSGNKLEGTIPSSLRRMVSLSRLDLAWNNLQGEIPQFEGNLVRLRSIDLSGNKLEGLVSHMIQFLWNSTMLEYLDISSNRFSGSLSLLSRFPFLRILSLQSNELNGSFIESRLVLPHLVIFDVSGNRLTGRVPDLGSCKAIEVLNLSDNMFNGNLTESIGYLSKLNALDLHSNQFDGIISEAHFSNTSQLGILDLSYNLNLTIKITLQWNPPFQLGTIKLASCRLGPNFPQWLQKQRKIAHLDISNSKIHDSVPSWFWDYPQSFQYLNMSFNKIYGDIPYVSSNFFPAVVDLSFNDFSGSLPLFPSGHKDIVNLSGNKFSGDVTAFCNATYGWTVLDLSNNQLSGEVSEGCFKNLMTMNYVNLANNNFSGELPSPTGWFCSLSILHLQNNSFRGELPVSFSLCSGLQIIDLSENYFTGNVPAWIGENLLELLALILRSNKLKGSLPSTLCHLTSIQLLDLSRNKISGAIPKCLNNFTAMSSKPDINGTNAAASIFERAYVVWQGRRPFYSEILNLARIIDFSSNNLIGEIPPEITSLEGIAGLNLSRNNFVGSIPNGISKLAFMYSLDLARNNLSGGIPIGLSRLGRLRLLNLSFNSLSGRIPWMGQLKNFPASSFAGNPGLCGLPLSKSCVGGDKS